jgi:hypothetical protein
MILRRFSSFRRVQASVATVTEHLNLLEQHIKSRSVDAALHQLHQLHDMRVVIPIPFLMDTASVLTFRRDVTRTEVRTYIVLHVHTD